jgi:hypothetical protein
VLQQPVFTREMVRSLPIGKNAGIYAALIPGAAPLNATQQDVGGTKGEDTQWFRMHNSGRSTQLRDGMFAGLPMGGANFNSSVNPATIDEVTIQPTGTLTAEATGDGPQTNFVPRDGGNVFSGSFATDFGHSKLQGDNVNDELRRLGFAYDLFGNGRTAVKAALGRFVPIQSNIPIGTSSGIVFPNNPVSAMVISSTRTWTDANGDYVPQ